jgi:hypothetical protein
MSTKESDQDLAKEILNRIDYFYLQTDGTHLFPNSREGDLLKMVHKFINSIKAEHKKELELAVLQTKIDEVASWTDGKSLFETIPVLSMKTYLDSLKAQKTTIKESSDKEK